MPSCSRIRAPLSGGGNPKRLLVDFLIGAHAILKDDRLLTLDASCYREDFPKPDY
jgi:predicted nucleic acid-binding protein